MKISGRIIALGMILLVCALIIVFCPLWLFDPENHIISNRMISSPVVGFLLVVLTLATVYIIGFELNSISNRKVNKKLDYAVLLMTPIVFTYALIFLFALEYRACHISPPPGETASSLDYLYFSIVTWTTTGYGDFTPGKDCRMYAATEALAGYFVASLTIAVLIAYFQKINARTMKLEANMGSFSSVSAVVVKIDGDIASVGGDICPPISGS